jgi:voltage-gated potassium channel
MKHSGLSGDQTLMETKITGQQNREVNFRLLFLGLLLLLAGGPVIRQYDWWDNPLLLEVIFATSSLLFITSLARDLRVFVLGLIPASLTIIFSVLAVLLGNDIFRYLMLIAALAFCVVAIKYAARDVFLSGAVDLNKIVGSVCIYLLLVVAWAIVYDFLELASPGSFAGLSAVSELSRFDEFAYFSLVTITTLGYGDITPENLVAGITAGLQATVGVFYTAVLVASLVGDFMARHGQVRNLD